MIMNDPRQACFLALHLPVLVCHMIPYPEQARPASPTRRICVVIPAFAVDPGNWVSIPE
jgi:hypothetical protein